MAQAIERTGFDGVERDGGRGALEGLESVGSDEARQVGTNECLVAGSSTEEHSPVRGLGEPLVSAFDPDDEDRVGADRELSGLVATAVPHALERMVLLALLLPGL
ncbi:hypothetical protein Acit_00295 [Aciditerrimonas ferrireducens]|nr:hypothetical protein [Aciditerrimonas ferrireducens]MCK4175959.1 hypothetical protein [Aciditerrimonas ferrireducens]